MPFVSHIVRCRERIEQELEKEPEKAPKVARDRDLKRARHEEARDMRIGDFDQRLHREVIEGNGASSSRDGAGRKLR